MAHTGSTYDDTWLIIPCYNEATVVGQVISNALTTFPNIVGVNDGSSDNSGDVMSAAGAHVVDHPVNLGQGAALQTGIEYARAQPHAQRFVTFDADGQHQIKDVVTMLDRLNDEDVDIIIGTRFGAGTSSRSSVPALKRVILKTIVLFSRQTRRLGLSDAHNGLRVFSLTVANTINIKMNGMSHASEFISLITTHGWKVSEEPVDILYTEYSMSKGQNLINGVNILSDTFISKRLR